MSSDAADGPPFQTQAAPDRADDRAPEAVEVTPFAAELLGVLQGYLGFTPRHQLLARLCEHREDAAPGLSPAALRLVEDTLAKGVTLRLARDGWQPERFLRAGRAASGAVWERSSPVELGLCFSSATIEFLLWSTGSAVDDKPWQRSCEKLALGDRLLLLVAYEAVREHELCQAWRACDPWRNDGLCQLLFASDFAEPARRAKIEWGGWFTPAGTAVLEVWQSRLADAWREIEAAKRNCKLLAEVQRIAANQRRAMRSFLDAADRVGRRDLARFVLPAVAGVLAQGDALDEPLRQVDFGGLRLAERQAVERDAWVLLEALDRLAGWQAEALATGYFDEGYAAAQLWKSDWEAYNGESLVAQSRRIRDRLRWG